MQQGEISGIQFKPNRSKKNIRIIYWVCIPFILLGLLLTGGELISWGSFFAGFSLLLLVLGHFFTSPRNVLYCAGENGIMLRAGKKAWNVSYSEIESVSELKEKAAEELMLKLKHKEESDERSIVFGEIGAGMNLFGRLKEAFRMQAKAFSPYKFLSVPIMYKGTKGEEKTQNVNLPCDCVFILLKSGEGYLISPLDTAAFVSEAKKYMPA